MASNSFDFPSNSSLTTGNEATQAWLQWFTRVHTVVSAAYMSGTTASRPTKALWVGRPFFDTTLGKPVWVKTAKPAVWVDATGAVV